MTRLLVWRHGQTAWNAENRVQGQTDVELTDTGHAQASAAAPKLAALQPDLIISSDLRRARDTAAPLAALTGLPVGTDARLRERHFGEWQGHTLAEVRERWPEGYAAWRAGETFTDGGVETTDEMAKRHACALQAAAEQAGDGTAVVVSHGGATRAGVAQLLGWSRAAAGTLGPLHNCHWVELRSHPVRGWQLMAYNVG